jgi:hypothetical protein
MLCALVSVQIWNKKNYYWLSSGYGIVFHFLYRFFKEILGFAFLRKISINPRKIHMYTKLKITFAF